MKRLTATVHGYVQGVAFRVNTQREASRLGVTGWVKNHWDGSVKVLGEGPDSAAGTAGSLATARTACRVRGTCGHHLVRGHRRVPRLLHPALSRLWLRSRTR